MQGAISHGPYCDAWCTRVECLFKRSRFHTEGESNRVIVSVRHGLERVSRAMRRLFRPLPEIRPAILETEDPSLYVRGDTAGAGPLEYPAGPSLPLHARLTSCLCTAELLDSDVFRYWIAELHEPWRFHRKLWEFGYVCQALYERGLLAPDKRGLGFAVGQEPLPSYFAAHGCEIVATDLDSTDTRAHGWAESGEWASTIDVLNRRGLCDPALFRQRVSFRPVDMNHIPPDLRGFDFTWSSCSFEHCGSIELGKQFLLRQMDCLKPGGVAVHTTEFNLTSNTSTATRGRTVLFRRLDIEDMVRRLRADGHSVEPLDLSVGTHPLDWFVDQRPYSADRHLRKRHGRYAATSIGLVIRKGSR